MIFVVGITQTKRVSPHESELLEHHRTCGIRGCGGQVRVIELQRRIHVCFIPLCLLSKTNEVSCPRCNTSLSLNVHLANCKRTNTQEANARVLKATPVHVTFSYHDEYIPILEKLEENGGREMAENSPVHTTDAIIV